MNAPIHQRFDDFVMPEPNSGCFLWLGAIAGGYGRLPVPGESSGSAHRFAWTRERGEIPTGLEIDHKCRVRSCCNPDHMELVTKAVNVMRGIGVGPTNAKKTHCPKGHEYGPQPRSYREAGRRLCTTCHREREAQRRAYKRGERN